MENNQDQKIHYEAGKVLLDMVKGKKIDKQQARAALTGYNSSIRAMSTIRVRDAMQYSVVKDLAKDDKQLREYVKATLPDYIPPSLMLK